MPIRAVLFDLDNTLILEDESTLHAVDAAARIAREKAGVDAAALSRAVAEVAESAWKALPEHAYCEAFGIWWGEGLWGGFSGHDPSLRALHQRIPGFRQSVWRGALAAVGVADADLARELEQEYIRVRRSAETIDPEAEPLLRSLAARHRLALVTNGAGDVQREKLSRTPFGPYFAQVIVSCEVGVGKPDPRIFRLCLERLGVVEPGNAVMVGDSLVRDVGGARSAGIQTVWIDRRLWSEPDAPAPDALIERLSDLPAALDALARRSSSPRVTS
jgi:putative hydrolase of the HAD superfamily